jgi:hypothetical protein
MIILLLSRGLSDVALADYIERAEARPHNHEIICRTHTRPGSRTMCADLLAVGILFRILISIAAVRMRQYGGFWLLA